MGCPKNDCSRNPEIAHPVLMIIWNCSLILGNYNKAACLIPVLQGRCPGPGLGAGAGQQVADRVLDQGGELGAGDAAGGVFGHEQPVERAQGAGHPDPVAR
jgi:hypothetical protein